MKIPQVIYNIFNEIDSIKRNGNIEQEEIDALKNTDSMFDVNSSYCYKIKPGMDIFSFIRENERFFRSRVQYTDNEYNEGRKIIENHTLEQTDKARKIKKDNKNSIQVEQGEYAIKTYSSKTPSIQTYNICSCIAVTIYDKTTKRGFVTHIDTAERAKSLKELLEKYKFNTQTSEVRIIGGQTTMSEGTLEIIDEILKNSNLKIVEYDILGETSNRNIVLDLKTGEVFDYEENKPTYHVAYDHSSHKMRLIKNELSDE